MRKKLSLLAIAGIAQASCYGISFTPSPANLGDLDHHLAYFWGLSWTLPAGQQIVSAQLRFTQIYDWQVEPDALYIHLFNNSINGVSSWEENPNDVLSDYFAGMTGQIPITTWSDPQGQDGSGTHAKDVIIPFTTSQIITLATYIQDDGKFGFGFDPDCHYFNSGVTFEITTSTTSVPEAGQTILLLGLGVTCLLIFRSAPRSSSS
jgi:hypothetical protein